MEHDPWFDVKIVRVYGSIYTVGDNTMLPGSVVAEVDQRNCTLRIYEVRCSIDTAEYQ